ncbi:hypothetical protein [Phytobacter massiliensis]|uniref:hypothetical protein n=1 Tax=Phytobacter massiliensis TaxID=1485952 RepID=UPI0005C63386|nr:hypothetical protein [Phytobacter massiliensis]
MTEFVKKNAGKCIYREILNETFDKIVVSLSFHRSPQSTEKYLINVEFEPLGMVGQGEGWIWWSTDVQVNDLLEFIRRFIGYDPDKIEYLPDYEKYFYADCISHDEEGKQSCLFENEYMGGYPFLPNLPDKTVWRIAPEVYKLRSIDTI